MRTYLFIISLNYYLLTLVLCLNNQNIYQSDRDNHDGYPDNFQCVDTKNRDLKTIKFSTPEECVRPCRKNETPKICRYNFTLEFYPALGAACNLCRPTTTQSLQNFPTCECILVDGYERTVFSVNRMIPGPQIQVCKNDYIVVDVKNQADGSEVAIHWHGLFQNNYQYYDGVPYITQCPIGSFTTFRYQFKAAQSGTYFWHSHIAIHRMDGQYGTLIIREPAEDNLHASLYDVDDPTHVIIISDWMHELATDRYPGLSVRHPGGKPDNILVNGVGTYTFDNGTETPINLATFEVQQGTRYRFRFINGFTSVCLSSFNIQNHSLLLIAQDGVDVEPVYVDTIISGAGERVDFVLHANLTINTYWIRVQPLAECSNQRIQQSAILKYVGGAQKPMSERSTYLNNPSRGIIYNPIDAVCDPEHGSICPTNMKAAGSFNMDILRNEPDVRLIISFGFHHYGATNTFTELFSANKSKYPAFMVAEYADVVTSLMDGISFNPPSAPPLSESEGTELFCEGKKSDYCNRTAGPLPCSCTQVRHIPLNSLVEVVLYDEYTLDYLIHPFHLHGSNFHVFDMGRFADNKNITMQDIELMIKQHERRLEENMYDRPGQKDTILVPLNGWVIFRYIAVNPGYWLFHCHFDWHSTSGMQMIFHVGNQSDLPPIPPGFPTCGSFQPYVCIVQ